MVHAGAEDDVTLRCSVQGRPVPAVAWRRGEGTLVTGGRLVVAGGSAAAVNSERRNRHKVHGGHTRHKDRQSGAWNVTADVAYEHRLNIRNVSEADYGEYVCEATNTLGTERGSVRLTGELLFPFLKWA